MCGFSTAWDDWLKWYVSVFSRTGYNYIYTYLRKVLVTGMIDAFCELIASWIFPWLVCLFLGFSVPLFLPWKQNQRKSKENCRIHPAQNQRKTKNIKGNQRKPKETKANQRILYPAVKNAWSSDVTNALLWHYYMNGSLVLLCVVNFHST